MKNSFLRRSGVRVLSVLICSLSLSASQGGSQRTSGSGGSNGRVRDLKAVPALITSPSYFYFIGKAAVRMFYLHRGDANRRARQAQAAQKTNNVANATNAGTSASVTAQNPTANTTANNLLNRAPFVMAPPRIVARSTNAPPKIQAPKSETETPKSLPIHEASGPPFNDRDQLLAYQQDQAEKGNPESQYAIGMRYLSGNGLEQSDELARQWLEKASANGNLRARAKLRELH